MADDFRPMASGKHPICTLSRRHFIGGLGVAAGGWVSRPLAVGQTPGAAKGAAQAPGLQRPAQLSSLDTRAKIALELNGHLQLAAGDDPKAAAAAGAEVRGKSTLDYLEKIALADAADTQRSQPVAAARRYVQAEVEHWIAGKTSRNKLRPDCVETRWHPHQGLWQQYCPHVPLDAREVQLLQSPINSAALELLLPTDTAVLGSRWNIRAEDAQQVFNLDAVHRTTLEATYEKLEQGVASVQLKGVLTATANSVPTRLEIQGNLQASRGRESWLVTWLAVVIDEQRQVSQSEPGFDITARVRLIRQESQNQLSVSDDTLRGLTQLEDEGLWLVRLHSTAGRYSMLADRRWHIHRDSPEEAILRMVENNTIIAQCAISRLSGLEAGQQLTLEGLQADIRRSLGDTFRDFLESSEKVTANKLRMLRTTVTGQVDGVPIQWIYIHLSDDSGRRLALVYTMGGNVTDRFGAADEQMAMSFEWPADPAASDSPPATAASTPPAATAASAAPPPSAPKSDSKNASKSASKNASRNTAPRR